MSRAGSSVTSGEKIFLTTLQKKNKSESHVEQESPNNKELIDNASRRDNDQVSTFLRWQYIGDQSRNQVEHVRLN